MRRVIIGQDTTYFGACLKDRSLIGFKPVTITIADNPDLFRHHTQIITNQIYNGSMFGSFLRIIHQQFFRIR